VKRAATFAAALALAAVAAGARPDCALACTCPQAGPERLLATSDAAFVGTLLEQRTAGEQAILVFAVERRLKGPLGDRVEVVTSSQPGMCGIAAHTGARVGLFLGRRGDAWKGSICGQTEPHALDALPTAASGEDVAESFAEATVYVLAIVALAAIGVFLLRRRLRPD
jgi:hypothetical protein